MKRKKVMPKSGQFVAIWEHNEELWSETYKWKGDELLVYQADPIDAFTKNETTYNTVLEDAWFFVPA